MKRMMVVAALVVVAQLAIAQDAKKGCNPEACRPGVTKVDEAKVITDLRFRVLDLSEKMGLDRSHDELVGSDENESLTLILKEVQSLSHNLNVETSDIQGSGAVLVKTLNQRVDHLFQLID